MSIDTIGNYLTIIRNGLLVSKRSVTMPSSKIRVAMTQILLDEGFIKGFTVDTSVPHREALTIQLKYVSGEPVIHELTRASKPGRRYYSKMKNVQPVVGGLGISILSTNAGVITDKKAKKLNVGGEVLCTIW